MEQATGERVTTAKQSVLAVIGGTGKLGWALARRWARAGHRVIIGSRTAEKASQAAARIERPTGALPVQGLANEDAAAEADIVIVTVPFASQADILAAIRDRVQGKLVVDATVPLVPPKVARVQLPPSDSAAVMAQQLLGEGTRVVSAFHNVAAHKLQTDEHIDCDILVFGDAPDDRQIVIELAAAADLKGVHGGPLANSTAAEALTSVLISINKRYKVDGAGLKITGLA